METKTISFYNLAFGSRVFVHYKGAIREAEYRGIKITTKAPDPYIEHILWLGDEIGENTVSKYKGRIYPSIGNAIEEEYPIPMDDMDAVDFSLDYLRNMVWDGFMFYGWIWDGSRPVKRAGFGICGMEIRSEGVSFVRSDGKGNWDAGHFGEFYQTAEECRRNNKPKVVMLEGVRIEENMKKDFYGIMKHYCPGFEDEICWDMFSPDKSMEENVIRQMKRWIEHPSES